MSSSARMATLAKNYRFYCDSSIDWGVILTDDPVDNYTVFRTFTEARAELIKEIRAHKRDWNLTLIRARTLRLEHVERYDD